MRALHINGMTPPALAVAIALTEKGLEFDLVEHDWTDTATALAAFADADELTNGLEGEFPILVDGGASLSDSLFILEYLDDRYADPPLRPSDAYGQWRVQALARFLSERALPGVSALGTAERFKDAPADPTAIDRVASSDLLTFERRAAWRELGSDAELAEPRRNATALLERVEGLASGEWLLGQQFTLADVAAFALVRALVELESGSLASYPATQAWADRVAQRPAVIEALALRPLTFLPGPELSRWG